MPTKLTNEIINAAIDGYGVQKSRIEAKIAELRAMLSGGTAETAATPEAPKRKRRRISAAGRRAISEATKKRWAAFHAAKQAEKPAAAKKTAPRKAAVKKVATIKAAVKKPAAKAAPAKAAKKSAPVKKSAPKKTAPAQAKTEAAAP